MRAPFEIAGIGAGLAEVGGGLRLGRRNEHGPLAGNGTPLQRLGLLVALLLILHFVRRRLSKCRTSIISVAQWTVAGPAALTPVVLVLASREKVSLR